jgi:hypothetical protein
VTDTETIPSTPTATVTPKPPLEKDAWMKMPVVPPGVLTCKRLILERYEPKERSKILTEVDNIRKRVEGK